MPFVTPDHRINPDHSIPGDLCYIHYKRMVEAWKAERRWTTAHKIYRKLLEHKRDTPLGDDIAAHDLAWQVFFIKHVMVYEAEKEVENGTI